MNKLAILLNITLFCSAVFLTNCSTRNTVENWNQTVNKVSSGVVSIQTDVPVAFDGRWNRSSYATGFVVDSSRGIILTNRHVVSPGPVTAKAILINNEEIDLTPLYFDPVHDFGFFKYEPNQIKHLDVHEFKLSNKPPSIGEAIRIIGNDAGQKVSILDGTISRLDRDAPQYGRGKYNDFNTFYIQAATSSTGGSSGSPVINIKGEAVALNAGSQSKSANAFYLPLEQIKLALEKIQNSQPIQRGTLQTTFVSTPYAELARLGLTDELAKRYRDAYPDLKGLLVVRKAKPKAMANDNNITQLDVGDVLLEINQNYVANFNELEGHLNSSVGKEISLTVLRRGQQLTMSMLVEDLHQLSPRSIVKFDGSVFHTLSYQQARHFNKPVQGVYVATSGGYFGRAGVPSRSVIVEFNGVNVATVEAFHEELKNVKSGEKIGLRYFDFSTPNSTNYSLVEINRKWFEHSYCTFEVKLNYWPCKLVETTLALEASTLESASSKNDISSLSAGEKTLPLNSEKREDALVNVSYYGPYSVQGKSGNQTGFGTGVIVDIDKGWVVVARSVVQSVLGDVKLTFNNRFEIPGKIEYIHPLHNLALVSYDPSEASQARVSEVSFTATPMNNGDSILQMGLNYDGSIEYRVTEVDTTEEYWLNQFNVPQFVDKNLDATHFVNPNTGIDGILINQANEVVGLWIIFDESSDDGKKASRSIAGISGQYVLDMIDSVKKNATTYSLDIDLTQIAPVDAIQMGLSTDWLDKIIKDKPEKNHVLAIYNVSTSSNSAAFLKRGDILLAVNDMPVSSFKQVESLVQTPQVNVTYFSEGEILQAQINTTPLTGIDIDRVLYWSGLYLHTPHRAAQMQGNVSSQGVYISSYTYGSPATRYGLYAIQKIVEIDGEPINTPDDFIAAVKDKPHQSSVVVKTIDFNNTPKVVTLRVDNHYWPFYEIRYRDGGWQKFDYSSQL